MSVNGITGASGAVSAYSAQQTATKPQTEAAASATEAKAAEEAGVVYEKSGASATDSSKVTYANPTLVAQLKQDAENRTAQLQSLVEKLMLQQSGTAAKAEGSIWDALRTGKIEVDPETRAQAQKDIAEDGYYGVKQTSDRILDFAQALAGQDPDKLEKMREAFKKGYEQAEKTWGGELPEISKQTFDAVMSKFDDLISGLTTQA